VAKLVVGDEVGELYQVLNQLVIGRDRRPCGGKSNSRCRDSHYRY
jgi:hypothetical protein